MTITAQIKGPVGDRTIADQLAQAASTGATAVITPNAVKWLGQELSTWSAALADANETIAEQRKALEAASTLLQSNVEREQLARERVLHQVERVTKAYVRERRLWRIAFWVAVGIAIWGWLT